MPVQASAYDMSSNIPLAKARHMAELRIRMRNTSLDERICKVLQQRSQCRQWQIFGPFMHSAIAITSAIYQKKAE